MDYQQPMNPVEKDPPNTTSMAPPPAAKCCLVTSQRCIGPGNTFHDANSICNPCLHHHELYKIREWASNNAAVTLLTHHRALELLSEKATLESQDPARYMCANRDPEYEEREWRLEIGKHKQGCLRAVDKRSKLCDNCWRANERAGNLVLLLSVFLGGSARTLQFDQV